LVPQPSLGLGLLHKIRLNFLEAYQRFSFLQDRVLWRRPRPKLGCGAKEKRRRRRRRRRRRS
jgi:hypothetical protein